MYLRIGRHLRETSNGRLPLKHGSVRPETLPKRVSDDLQHFIVRRRKFLFREFFGSFETGQKPKNTSEKKKFGVEK